MTLHLLKLIWNRKRANALLIVEIACSFVVLFGVVLVATYYADNVRRPIGFVYDDVWYVGVDANRSDDGVMDQRSLDRMRLVMHAAADLPEVESVAAAFNAPFTFSHNRSIVRYGDRVVEHEAQDVTDEFARVMQLEVTRGRWFTPEDDAAAIRPVVINERLAAELFGDEDPVGRVLGDDDSESRTRVVGVVAEYRQDGEISGPANTLFNRSSLTAAGGYVPRNLLIKVRPGTAADFEVRLLAALQATERDSSFEAQPLAELRDSWIQAAVGPLLVAGLIAGFLMLMVALGLTGVLWQTITQRTREIGLRRVQGATAADIYIQFLGELALITTIAVTIGTLVVVQAPIIGLTEAIGPKVYIWSLLVSAGSIYALTAACGLYPSRFATRIEPVHALRYE
jgi:putative ABC transport system permease protein